MEWSTSGSLRRDRHAPRVIKSTRNTIANLCACRFRRTGILDPKARSIRIQELWIFSTRTAFEKFPAKIVSSVVAGRKRERVR